MRNLLRIVLLLINASVTLGFLQTASTSRLVGSRTTCPLATADEGFYSSGHATEADEADSFTTTSVDFALHPYSEEAVDIVTNRLGLTKHQHYQLAKLATLIVEWNSKINLISRKDCTLEVVFGRHILPSLAMLKLDNSLQGKVIDVGTGGGFPGLPLAIALPDVEFLLVDSVGKKLKVVQDISDVLELENLRTHHARAEEMVDDPVAGSSFKQAFDVCVGRSVAAIPRFCFWVQDFLKPPCDDSPAGGRLMYIIGGEVDDDVLSKVDDDIEIDELLDQQGASGKRILVFPQQVVLAIAESSGEVKRKIGKPRRSKMAAKRKKLPKGAWGKRDPSAPKQRGYEGFRRYEG